MIISSRSTDRRAARRAALSLALTIFLGTLPLLAQEAPVVPELQGFDTFAAAIMAKWKVPGLAIAVVRDGAVIYSRGLGFRDLDKKLPVTPHTIFGIGSCSKAFTAATMGILVDEGKIEWDKPVRDYLPTFRLSDEIVSDRITPRDLLTHRTGLPRQADMAIGADGMWSSLRKMLGAAEPGYLGEWHAFRQYFARRRRGPRRRSCGCGSRPTCCRATRGRSRSAADARTSGSASRAVGRSRRKR